MKKKREEIKKERATEKLTKKARITDYADRTEYDEALEIVLSQLSTLENKK